MPEHDRYGEFLKSLRRDAQRYGFFGAEKYLAELLMGKGDVEATMRVAEIYLKEAETEDAVKQQRAQKNVISALQLASVGGSADAYMMLGDFYRYGKCGLVKNEKEAMAAYAKAAELSSGDAYLVLAEMHLDDAYGKAKSGARAHLTRDCKARSGKHPSHLLQLRHGDTAPPPLPSGLPLPDAVRALSPPR